MRYNEKYFKHVDNCQCDIDKIKETMEAAVSRRAPWEVDKDGNGLFYCDSFGWRGPIPGETDECYQAMSKARSEASKIPEGCTCMYSSNGVWDGLEDDCPLTEEEHP
jgi:hypothetical protein